MARQLNQTKSRKGHVLCHCRQVLVNAEMEFISRKLRGMLRWVLYWSVVTFVRNVWGFRFDMNSSVTKCIN